MDGQTESSKDGGGLGGRLVEGTGAEGHVGWWTDGWVGGQAHGWVDGRTTGWVDGPARPSTQHPLSVSLEVLHYRCTGWFATGSG